MMWCDVTWCAHLLPPLLRRTLQLSGLVIFGIKQVDVVGGVADEHLLSVLAVAEGSYATRLVGQVSGDEPHAHARRPPAHVVTWGWQVIVITFLKCTFLLHTSVFGFSFNSRTKKLSDHYSSQIKEFILKYYDKTQLYFFYFICSFLDRLIGFYIFSQLTSKRSFKLHLTGWIYKNIWLFMFHVKRNETDFK